MDRRIFMCGVTSALGISFLPKKKERLVRGRPMICLKEGGSDPRPVKWAKKHLTYCIAARDTTELGIIEWDIEIGRAFQSWADVINMRFTKVYKPEEADIVIATGNHPAERFGRPGGILAWAQKPTSDKHKTQLISKYDIAENWTTETPKIVKDGIPSVPSNGIHLEAVACHEIGHLLGLPHIPIKESLMYPEYSPDIAAPTRYDIQLARTLYK